MNSGIYDQMSATWARVAARFPAYELLLPGSTAFVCKAEACEAHCCKVYSVSLGDREVGRLRSSSGLHMVEFLECEDGQPIVLPLAQPFMLARKSGTCALLGDDLRCGQYHGRPDACRLYPHFVIVFREQDARPIYSEVATVRAAVRAVVAGAAYPEDEPLLLRHLECPGFTGAPLAEEEWRELIVETARLQYEEASNP